MAGRPMNTALAPRASAFSTSVPVRTPPSMYTSQRPSTACTISLSTSIYTVNNYNTHIVYTCLGMHE